jgi:hypothetical protein
MSSALAGSLGGAAGAARRAPFAALRIPRSVTTFYVRYRNRGDPPGQWRRSGPFADRSAAQAWADAWAAGESGVEIPVVVGIEDEPACS